LATGPQIVKNTDYLLGMILFWAHNKESATFR
jgi:hypothetical protein